VASGAFSIKASTESVFLRSSAEWPDYFHKVVDCQWACPAHTPVPEYIRLIAQGRYDDAYMVNWVSNVFPGILGRTCDRPCEPACRRGRVEESNGAQPEPVAICRLKRVAADNKTTESRRACPAIARNGKRVACVGAGPASLTVARDLAPLGYEVTVFDAEAKAGGFIRSQIPRFRLPESVIDEETGYILDMGVQFRNQERVDSLRRCCSKATTRCLWAAARRAGAIWKCPGRREASAATSISASTGWPRCRSGTSPDRQARHRAGRRQHRHGLLPLGAAPGRHRRQGHRAQRLRRNEGLALGKGRRPARGHSDPQLPCAQAFEHDNGQLTGMTFEMVQAEYDDKGRRSLVPTGEPDVRVPCDVVLIAVGQENAFPLDRGRLGIAFDRWGLPCSTGHLSVHAAPGVLRRRRGLRPQEHHHRRGAGARGGRVDRPFCTAKTCASARRRAPT
jgi:formate dehydrogenase beta subunit